MLDSIEISVTRAKGDIPRFKVLHIEELPARTVNNDSSAAIQIASYMKRLLAEWGDRQCSTLVLPPLTKLARHFGVSEIEVFDAFYELMQEGYDYSLNGIDSLITLTDTLDYNRREMERHWSAFTVITSWLFRHREQEKIAV